MNQMLHTLYPGTDVVGTRNLARPFFEKIEKSTRRKKGVRNVFSRTGYAKNKSSVPPQKNDVFFRVITPKFSSRGNRRGYVYPPKFSQAQNSTKNRTPQLGGYGTFFFSRTWYETCKIFFFSYQVRGFRATSVPGYRVLTLSSIYSVEDTF